MKNFLTILIFVVLLLTGISLEDMLVDNIVNYWQIVSFWTEVSARVALWVVFSVTLTPVVLIASVLLSLITRRLF